MQRSKNLKEVDLAHTAVQRERLDFEKEISYKKERTADHQERNGERQERSKMFMEQVNMMMQFLSKYTQ